MKFDIKNAAEVAHLHEALLEIVKIGKKIEKTPAHGYRLFERGITLQLSATEMHDGVGQGSEHYCHLPPSLAPAILDAATATIKERLQSLGVEP